MFKQKIRLFLTAALIAISPVAIVASCSQNSGDNQASINEQTLLNKKVFNASDLGLNLDITQAIKQINEIWIIKYKNRIFKGTTSYLNDPKQIENIQVDVNKNEMIINFQLAANAYVDQSGNLASLSSPNFNFIVKGFDNKQPDQTIALEPIARVAKFKVSNLNQLASNVQSKDLVWEQESSYPQLEYKINNLVADDQNGRLGFNFTIYQKDLITNSLTTNILPSDPQAISGFKTVVAKPSDQQLVDEEINRLSDRNISATQLTNLQLTKYQQQPQLFLEHLQDLKQDQFGYDILNFNYQQSTSNQATIIINLKVSYQSASKTKTLTKTINVLNINLNNPQLVRATEEARLNRLIKNSYLLKTNFNQEEIEKLIKNPNDVLNLIFKFISQQYFHYKVIDLNVVPTSKNQSTINANLTFRISAKYWKTVEQNPPIINSQIFTYPITITYQPDIPIPQPTPTGWKIKPSDKATPSKEDDGVTIIEDEYDLTINLNQDPKLDFALLDWSTNQPERLVDQIFKDKQDLIITTIGDLPKDWVWNNYVNFYNYEAIENQNKQINGLSVRAQFDYVDSDDLSKWFTININFTNGFNSGKTPTKPTNQEVWNQIEQEFQTLINKQAFDQNKLHQGLNGVYSFSQINVDKVVNGDHFSNFLNFSLTEFEQKWQFLVKVEITDASINYLTNTVEFKWHLVGQKELAQFKWDSPTLIKLKYEPKDQWKDQITFSNQDQLAIPGSASINNILDRFTLNNQFIGKENLKERFGRFGKNWTWKAREFANYVRFTFYQAFNDGAEAINMAIENLPQDDYEQNPSGYTIVLKAKLNQKAVGNYLPYLQMFGSDFGAQARNWNAGDIIEIRLRVDKPDLRPDVVTDSNEIFPGMNPGIVLGNGQGAIQAYLNTPPRMDLYSIALGSTNLTIKHNQQQYVSLNANHRFLALNMLSRYDFKDPIWNEPPLDSGWTK